MSMSENEPKSNTNTGFGTMLGQYRLEELVASGGMARIYKAVDTNLERTVAVKVLMPELIDLDDTLIERFEREAKAVAQLEHDNIVRIYDYRRQDDRYYIVMNYIEGHDLADELNILRRENRLMDVSRALRLLAQVAQALDFAHAAGIVHRDVKPSNVLLTKKDKAILTDFGLVLRQSIDKTMGTAFGTPRYIAPEQALASENSVPQSDIYSLAVIIYEILTGQMLFFSENPMQIAMSHINEPPTPPSSINPTIPAAAERELLKALAKNPVERHRSASELISALKQAYRDVAASAGASSAQQKGAHQTLVLSDDDNSRELLKQSFEDGPKDKRKPGEMTITFLDDTDTTREAALLASWDEPSAKPASPEASAPPVPAPVGASGAAAGTSVSTTAPTTPANAASVESKPAAKAEAKAAASPVPVPSAVPASPSHGKATAESKQVGAAAPTSQRRGLMALVGGVVVALVLLGGALLLTSQQTPGVDPDNMLTEAGGESGTNADEPPTVLLSAAMTLPPVISPTATTLPALAPVTGGQPVRLEYNDHILVLRNLDGGTVSVAGLELAKIGAESGIAGTRVENQVVPAAGCVGLVQAGHSFNQRQWDCTGRTYYDEVTVAGEQLFWRTAQPGQFEVRVGGSVIAYCTTVQRGGNQTCEFNIPAQAAS